MMSCRNVDYRPMADDTDTSGMNMCPETTYARPSPYSSGRPYLNWQMIPLLTKNKLEMPAVEPLLSLYDYIYDTGTYTIFGGIAMFLSGLAVLYPVNCTRFHWTDKPTHRLTDRQTDRQTEPIA